MREYRVLRYGREGDFAVQHRPRGWWFWPWRWMRVWVANGLPGGDYEVPSFTSIHAAREAIAADARAVRDEAHGWRQIGGPVR